MVMFQKKSIRCLLALTALTALVLMVTSANAQRRRGMSGASSSSNNNNNSNQQNNNSNNNSSDDKDKKSSKSTSNNSNNSNSSNVQQNVQQFQQLMQGGGGTQGSGQGMRSMRSTRGGGSQTQVIGPGQGIQIGAGSQLGQNFQPWQMWQGQNNRGNNNNNLRGRSGNSNSSNWFVQVGGGSSPFSIGWYEKHPHAWHWHDKHNNDVWKVATAASVIGWLGWGAPQTQYVVYQPVPANTYIFDPNASGPWMLLGVYTLLTGPSDMGSRTLQLSINQQGFLRGTYYDMITDEVYNVRGRVDQASQYAQWSIDTNRNLIFYTPLYQLTQSQGVVNANLPGGTQQWQLARMDYAN
jgi:hypothetical protein